MTTMSRLTVRVAAALLVTMATGCSGGHASPATSRGTTQSFTATATPPDASTTHQPGTAAPAAAQPHIVAISAGHGGPHNVGAVHKDASGNADLVEKDLTLDVARRLNAVLQQRGYRTVMIRDGDYSLSNNDTGELTTASVRAESLARADVANGANADIVLALHFNGSEDASQSGTEIYYNPDRSFGQQNARLAMSVYDALLSGIRGLGYAVHPRGIMNDAPIGERYGQAHTFLLGDALGAHTTTMPGLICEPLFLTNEGDAELLKRDGTLRALAVAYADGIDAYFRD
jgi:N-acetylmuramoyl-L-alanine amidase